MNKSLILVFLLFSYGADAQLTLSSRYFSMTLNGKGYITSMVNTSVSPRRQFSPADKPSSLLCLFDSKKKLYYYPVSAVYNRTGNTVRLRYSNGSVATVRISTVHDLYFKFVLQDVVPRHGVDGAQWGPYHTNITNLFGEIIGVARDTSETGNFAIGVLALNDTTVGGPAADHVPFQYIIHTPDAHRFPLPKGLFEGENFSVGGDGINDVAFYSHPEEYFRMLYGDAAWVDSLGRISICYHATDRRKGRSIYDFSPTQLPANAANHQDVQAVPSVDIKGSAIAFYGCPDSVALLGVIKKIVLDEGLPYPAYAFNGSKSKVWVKDPARYTPDVSTSGRLFDSTISYVSQLGFKAIQAEDLPYFWPHRGDDGYIDGNPPTKFPFHFTAGNKTHKQFSHLTNPLGIDLGRHTVTTALGPGTKDADPPSDSLCVLLKKILAKDIGGADTVITVTDPTYLNETGPAEGHDPDLNIIKIGKELIHYLGVSRTPPYRLQQVTRGYWKTSAAAHTQGDTIYKLQATCGGGYAGLIPDIDLQDSIAAYYADVSIKNGIHYIDWDGEEFLFDQAMGSYSVKRFHRVLFHRAAEGGIPYLRIMGATLSEGSWHYQSVWNVGGGKNMYDPVHRSWGIEGKDIRNVAFANYFPATFGITYGIGPSSTVQQFENLEAVSVGVGVTYMLDLRQKDVESCPVKYPIFSAIRTWENARAAAAFPSRLKKELADTTNFFHLRQVDADTWDLYRVDAQGNNPVLYQRLSRAPGY
ncbi:MAG TPA: hypothetical protein VGS79_28340 [Puia sp.]|nr:hypothetical protein [Puia sp.]